MTPPRRIPTRRSARTAATIERKIAEYVARQRQLILLERDEEIRTTAELQATLSARELADLGLCWLNLEVVGERSGLGGRVLLDLAPTRDERLRSGRLGPGDIVGVRSQREAPGGKTQTSPRDLVTAVVARMTPRGVTIVLDDVPERFPAEPLRLDRLANDVTYRRLEEVLEQLPRYRGGPASRLRKILFGDAPPRHDAAAAPSEVDDRLDASQRDAVQFAAAQEELALVHGPPGTGKTTTIAELIRQCVRRGQTVLACAPSNVAVDNLVEHLVARELDVVRTGHPARLLPSVVDHSLDSLVEQSEGAKIAGDVRRELDQAFRRMRRCRTRRERFELRGEIRQLRHEVRHLEKLAVKQVLTRADVVLATIVGAGDPLLGGMDFDVVVVDEAAQAIEASTWIPLLKGRKLVLAGDHRQLPPTVCSQEAARQGLAETLFERLANEHGDAITRMLTVQYRMHEKIMRWSSNELYDGRIVAHESVRHHLLADLPGTTEAPELSLPLLLIDTAGCDLEEAQDERGTSRYNEGEAHIVATHVRQLVDAGVGPQAIGVISPYNAQVALLRNLLESSWPQIEIGSVDGFQGREKEAIIISMVRSNPAGDVGFLAEERRMNVAVTRARRHVALIGDSATVSHHPFLGRLIEYFQEEGEYRTAWEYR